MGAGACIRFGLQYYHNWTIFFRGFAKGFFKIAEVIPNEFGTQNRNASRSLDVLSVSSKSAIVLGMHDAYGIPHYTVLYIYSQHLSHRRMMLLEHFYSVYKQFYRLVILESSMLPGKKRIFISHLIQQLNSLSRPSL